MGLGLGIAKHYPGGQDHDQSTHGNRYGGEKPKGYDEAAVKAKREWEADLVYAASMGLPLTPDQEREAGYLFGGGDSKLTDLPDILYHATTARSAIEGGGLMSRLELEATGKGLGGGSSHTISFTTDRKLAESIRDALIEVRSVLRGDITIEQLIDQAKKGTGADKPYFDSLLRAWGGTVKEGDELPQGIANLVTKVDRKPTYGNPSTLEDFRAKNGEEWEGDEKWTHGTRSDLWGSFKRPYPPAKYREDMLQFYKNFSAVREVAGGAPDPLIWGGDPEYLATFDPAEAAVLAFKPKPGTKGVQMGGMSEWRVGTGHALELVKDIAKARKHTMFDRWDDAEFKVVTRKALSPVLLTRLVKHLPGQHDQSDHGNWARDVPRTRHATITDKKAAELDADIDSAVGLLNEYGFVPPSEWSRSDSTRLKIRFGGRGEITAASGKNTNAFTSHRTIWLAPTWQPNPGGLARNRAETIVHELGHVLFGDASPGDLTKFKHPSRYAAYRQKDGLYTEFWAEAFLATITGRADPALEEEVRWRLGTRDALMKRLLTRLAKHLPGRHDQSTHGNWATPHLATAPPPTRAATAADYEPIVGDRDAIEIFQDLERRRTRLAKDWPFSGPLAKEAIKDYATEDAIASDYSYEAVNVALRLDRYSGPAKEIDDILQPVPYPMVLFRSLPIHRLEGDVGDIISDKAFLSTTLSRAVALQWASARPEAAKDAMLEIHVPKGTRAFPVMAHPDAFLHEAEFLIDNDAKLRIDKVSEEVVTMTNFRGGVTEKKVKVVHATLLSTSGIGKHLLGEHDQKAHGNWAHRGQAGEKLYHASATRNRASILKEGLRLSDVDRQHLWASTRIEDLEDFTGQEFDVWEIDAEGLEQSSEFHPGFASGKEYTRVLHTAVPATRLRLVRQYGPRVKGQPRSVLNKHYGPGSHPGTGTSQEIHAEKVHRVWHLTARSKFKLDSKFVGNQNYIAIDYNDQPGIYVTDNPEHWVNGYDYVRPFIVELEYRGEKLPGAGVPGQQQNFIPATEFDRLRIVRVIPLDEYVREEFHDQGWVERHFDPIEHDWNKPYVEPFPKDYRYTGPDVRDMPPEEIKRLRDRTRQYLREARPQVYAKALIELRKHYGPGPHPGTGTDQAVHGGNAFAYLNSPRWREKGPGREGAPSIIETIEPVSGTQGDILPIKALTAASRRIYNTKVTINGRTFRSQVIGSKAIADHFTSDLRHLPISYAFQIEGEIVDEAGQKVGQFTRTLDYPTAKNDFYKLNNDLQGKGIGTAFLAKWEDGLRDSRFTESKVHTAWVGHYAWAMSGYEWNDYDRDTIMVTLRNMPGRWERQGVPKNFSAKALAGVRTEIADLVARWERKEPVSIFEVATIGLDYRENGTHWGKDFLLNDRDVPNWYGTKKL